MLVKIYVPTTLPRYLEATSTLTCNDLSEMIQKHMQIICDMVDRSSDLNEINITTHSIYASIDGHPDQKMAVTKAWTSLMLNVIDIIKTVVPVNANKVYGLVYESHRSYDIYVRQLPF